MPYCRSLSVTWKRGVMLGALAAFSTILGRIAEATEASSIRSPGLNTDQLGESLKKFRSLHTDAKCIVRPIEWSDERSFKTNWLLWVDCSLEKGVSFEGQELLARSDPDRPFGVFASFYKRKLIELSYTLSTTSIEDLLPILHRVYGKPDQVTRSAAGILDSVTWAYHKVNLDVELVPISPAVVDGNFLRIGKGLVGNAVRIRIRPRTTPPHP
jgi:hypothetical protein